MLALLLGWLATGTPGPAAGRALLASRRHAAGSDWKPATSAGRTIAGVFPAGRDQGPLGGLDLAGRAGQFGNGQATPCAVGMLIGSVYRLRVTNIPSSRQRSGSLSHHRGHRSLLRPAGPGMPLCDSHRVDAGRPQAGAGRQVRHPRHLPGRPANTLPTREVNKSQNWFEVSPGQDPLAAADALGRPVAILRLGGRLPEASPERLLLRFAALRALPGADGGPIKAKPRGGGQARTADKAVQPKAKATAADEKAATGPRRHLPLRRGKRSHERHFPSWSRCWRPAVIAVGVLILCSCRAAAPPPVDLTGVHSGGYATLPEEAFTRGTTGSGGAAIGPPGMEKGVPMPYTPTGPWSPPGHQHALAERRIPPRRRPPRPARHPRQPRRNPRPADGRHRRPVPDQRRPVPPPAQQSRLPLQPALRRRPASRQPARRESRSAGRRRQQAGQIGHAGRPKDMVGLRRNLQVGDDLGGRPAGSFRTKLGSAACRPRWFRGFQDAFKPFENSPSSARAC